MKNFPLYATALCGLLWCSQGLAFNVHPFSGFAFVSQIKEAEARPTEPCNWDEVSMQERVELWTKMGPRHKEYHWRLMSMEERLAFRTFLPLSEQRKLKERFISKPDHFDRPYVLYKRLSKEELFVLREQIRRAQPNHGHKHHKRSTPAVEELELVIAGKNPHHSGFVILVPQPAETQVQERKEESEETLSTEGKEDLLMAPVLSAPEKAVIAGSNSAIPERHPAH